MSRSGLGGETLFDEDDKTVEMCRSTQPLAASSTGRGLFVTIWKGTNLDLEVHFGISMHSLGTNGQPSVGVFFVMMRVQTVINDISG